MHKTLWLYALNWPICFQFSGMFCEKKTPLFPKIADMQILLLKAPLSAIFRTLMRILQNRLWVSRCVGGCECLNICVRVMCVFMCICIYIYFKSKWLPMWKTDLTQTGYVSTVDMKDYHKRLNLKMLSERRKYSCWHWCIISVKMKRMWIDIDRKWCCGLDRR